VNYSSEYLDYFSIDAYLSIPLVNPYKCDGDDENEYVVLYDMMLCQSLTKEELHDHGHLTKQQLMWYWRIIAHQYHLFDT
jgi:hypothetical protein